MKRAGTKLSYTVFWAGFFTFVAVYGFINPLQCQAFDASINVSPNIINLQSTDHVFGIHTNIPYSIVNIDSVLLVCPQDAFLYPTLCHADSRGYLVANFNTADLEENCEFIIGDTNILVLEGETKIEPIELFSGAGEVLVIKKEAKFKKDNGFKTMQNRNCQK